MAAGRVTGHRTVEACALKVCGSNKEDEGDAAGNFEAAVEKTSASFAGGEVMEAETESFLASHQGMEAQTKRKMFMSPEDMDVILSHEARGDSFKQFQARIRKEVAETGHFEISEEYFNKVFQHRAWIRQEWSNLRSQYPNLVWEEEEEDEPVKSG